MLQAAWPENFLRELLRGLRLSNGFEDGPDCAKRRRPTMPCEGSGEVATRVPEQCARTNNSAAPEVGARNLWLVTEACFDEWIERLLCNDEEL